jgi:hypothetical protein
MTSIFTDRRTNFDDYRNVVFLTVGSLCTVIVLGVLACLTIFLLTWSSEEMVTGPVLISSQWAEFSPRKPLVPAKQYQVILLEVDPAEALVVDNSNLERIQLGNGVLLKPEIELVDSEGNIFVAEVYRSPVPSYLDNSIVGNVRDLPQDRRYTKVRVRSNVPVRLSRIVWYCSKTK